MRRLTMISSLLLASIAMPLQAAPKQDIKMFPEAKSNEQRGVIRLPKLDDESSRKVEVMISKPMTVDCNTRRLAGDLQAEDLPGWGYNYYRLAELKGPISTLMACPKGSEKKANVPVFGDGYLLRYNSRLPLVIYAPAETLVEYRIWSADKTAQQANRE